MVPAVTRPSFPDRVSPEGTAGAEPSVPCPLSLLPWAWLPLPGPPSLATQSLTGHTPLNLFSKSKGPDAKIPSAFPSKGDRPSGGRHCCPIKTVPCLAENKGPRFSQLKPKWQLSVELSLKELNSIIAKF